ncbi:transcription factor ATOH8 [Onthophagus taurus]|uniref:transcription factor ATOH8 n=1 Tax=Onthophagus taurus TaxID=166361 RepID=UPI000C20B84C|nr:protein atonal homolog 8 [Onthophagus taurus]
MMTYSNGRTIVTSAEMDQTPLCPTDDDFTDEIHSPTGSSEDSVEVKVEAISLKNKRKCVEPRRVQDGPPKKRLCLQNSVQHFRPWSLNPEKLDNEEHHPHYYHPLQAVKPEVIVPLVAIPEVSHGYFRPPSPVRRSPSPVQEPVALVKRKEVICDDDNIKTEKCNGEIFAKPEVFVKPEVLRVPVHPIAAISTAETEHIIKNSVEAFPRLQQNNRKEQRNYKNMTRERRIEANARERTRVHTISAAFDTLRKSVPAYSSAQKLSKLSVLRVACSYIATLSSMLQDDDSHVAQCVDQVTKTIQREGKLRKKKDDID